MGYSVYVLVSSDADKILRQVFDRNEIKRAEELSFHTPVFRGSDLGYSKEKHKEKTVFGINYGAEYEIANAIVATVADLLGREKYWLDGNEMLKVRDAIWWHKPKRQVSVLRNIDRLINREKYKKIDNLIKLIRYCFDDIKFWSDLRQTLKDNEC